jgi:predicted double-glycine peptidase
MKTRAFKLALMGCALSAGTGAEAQSTFLTGVGPVADARLPIKNMVEMKFATVVRQRYDFSCGSAALATLLRYHYGYAADEERVFRGMWTEGDRDQIRKVGFSLLDMKRYLNANNIKADGYKVSLDQIAETGIPGIALVSVNGYRHFVVLKGVTPAEVLVGDPSAGLQRLPRSKFEKSWNGVYFVLNSDQELGRSAFNRDVQWAAFSRAPVGGRFVDPLSLQALSLTAPFYRDF